MKLTIGNATVSVEGTSTEDIFNALLYEHREFLNGKWVKTNRSMFNRRTKQFLTGLLPRVISHLSSIGTPFVLSDARTKSPAPTWPVELQTVQLRDYQQEAAQSFLKARRGIIKASTGSGKTIIAAAIIKAAAVPTLFLVHRTHLLCQTAEKFIQAMPEIEPHLGIIGDGSRDFKPITLATVQTVASMLKRYGKRLQQELGTFRMMIIDEAHRATAEQFVTVAKNLVNCDYRLGLTATPFMSGKERDNLILHGLFGNIVYEVSASELIRQGVLARPFFKFYPVTEPRLFDLKNYRDVYEQGVIHNQHRNKLVADKTLELVRMGRKTLVICSELKHITILHAMLCERGLSVGVATGSADSRERKKTLDSLASGGYDCIICSTIFDEGVDLPDIGGVVLAAGNKSAPALLQRTGRAIRLKEKDNFAVIVDFYDTTHRMLEKHAKTRIEIIQQEPEFRIL